METLSTSVNNTPTTPAAPQAPGATKYLKTYEECLEVIDKIKAGSPDTASELDRLHEFFKFRIEKKASATRSDPDASSLGAIKRGGAASASLSSSMSMRRNDRPVEPIKAERNPMPQTFDASV